MPRSKNASCCFRRPSPLPAHHLLRDMSRTSDPNAGPINFAPLLSGSAALLPFLPPSTATDPIIVRESLGREWLVSAGQAGAAGRCLVSLVRFEDAYRTIDDIAFITGRAAYATIGEAHHQTDRDAHPLAVARRGNRIQADGIRRGCLDHDVCHPGPGIRTIRIRHDQRMSTARRVCSRPPISAVR